MCTVKTELLQTIWVVPCVYQHFGFGFSISILCSRIEEWPSTEFLCVEFFFNNFISCAQHNSIHRFVCLHELQRSTSNHARTLKENLTYSPISLVSFFSIASVEQPDLNPWACLSQHPPPVHHIVSANAKNTIYYGQNSQKYILNSSIN